jgi:DNA-binding NarL/FixJ family response regulator
VTETKNNTSYEDSRELSPSHASPSHALSAQIEWEVMRERSIQVLIADDHPVVRTGLKTAIREDPLLEVVGEASDGEAAVAQIERLHPDIAIIDINMPKLDGIGAARAIRKRNLPVAIIFLTVHTAEDLFEKAMDLGANGYILKDSAMLEIVSAIRAVSEGGYYVSGPMMGHLMRRRAAGIQQSGHDKALAELTPAELRIVRMIASNKTSKEIAGELGLNFRTIENRRTTICEKLDLRGANALLKFALEHKDRLG